MAFFFFKLIWITTALRVKQSLSQCRDSNLLLHPMKMQWCEKMKVKKEN